MRISDWSSDVCSSDLSDQRGRRGRSSSRQRLAAAYWLLPVRSFPRPLCRLGTARRRSSRRALGMTPPCRAIELRSEEHTSELQSLMRISYAGLCLKKKKTTNKNKSTHTHIYNIYNNQVYQ